MLPPDRSDEFLGSRPSQLGQLHVDTGQRPSGYRGDLVRIVEPDDSDVLRHRDASFPKPLEDTPRDLVAAAKDAVDTPRCVEENVDCMTAPRFAPLTVQPVARDQ